MGRGSKPALPEKVGDLLGAANLRPMSTGASPAARPVSPVTTQAPVAADQQVLQDYLAKLGITGQQAAIGGGAVLGTVGLAGLGGADGGDAVLGGALGAAVPAAMAFNRKRRGMPVDGRDLVGLVAAGAGAGTGSSLLLDALGLTNQEPSNENLMVRYV